MMVTTKALESKKFNLTKKYVLNKALCTLSKVSVNLQGSIFSKFEFAKLLNGGEKC